MIVLSGTLGQVSANSVDYTVSPDRANAVRFAFALDQDDIITATVFQSGS